MKRSWDEWCALDAQPNHPWFRGLFVRGAAFESVPGWCDGYFLRSHPMSSAFHPVILVPEIRQGATGKYTTFHVEEVAWPTSNTGASKTRRDSDDSGLDTGPRRQATI